MKSKRAFEESSFLSHDKNTGGLGSWGSFQHLISTGEKQHLTSFHAGLLGLHRKAWKVSWIIQYSEQGGRTLLL